jgi:hypothetical protein
VFNTTNLTDIVITPTQTVIISQVGPMQVNLTFLNPIEVRLDPFFFLLQAYAYASFKAWGLDQAILSVLIHRFHCKILGWLGSCCATLYRYHWRYVEVVL